VRQTTLNSAGSVALCDVGGAADSYGVLLMCRTQCINYCNVFFYVTGLVIGSKLSGATSHA